MKELSIFSNFKRVVAVKTYETIADEIRNGQYKAKVGFLQQLIAEGKENEYSRFKKTLPAFTPSGRFVGGRKVVNMLEYSKLIILEIDNLNKEKLIDLREKVIQDNFTYSCFVSPSGRGLKILVKTENSLSKHSDTFFQIRDYYKNLLGDDIEKLGKNFTCLCFLSYDKELYINHQSKAFREVKKSEKSNYQKTNII